MRIMHYRYELPEEGIIISGGLESVDSRLAMCLADWEPLWFSCSDLTDELMSRGCAPIRMTHSPRGQHFEPYPDLTRLLPFIKTKDERFSSGNKAEREFVANYRKIFLGKHPDWYLMGAEFHCHAIYLLYQSRKPGYGEQYLSIGSGDGTGMPELHLTFRLPPTAGGIEPVYHVHTMMLDDENVTLVREQRGSTQRDMLVHLVDEKVVVDTAEYVDL